MTTLSGRGADALAGATDVPAADPYPPSWIDRLMTAVERLPVPYWLVYLVLFVLEVAVVHIVAWAEGALPYPAFEPAIASFAIWLWGPLAIMTYLDAAALEAVRSFRPLLALDGEQMRDLEYRFSTMPPRPVVASGLIWAVVYVGIFVAALPVVNQRYPMDDLGRLTWFVTGLVSFWVGSAIYYHTIHQLRLVRRTVALARSFNLFRLGPAYALSRFTARTAILWIALVSTTILTLGITVPVVTLSLAALQITLALAAFVVPVWSVHQRLVAEKRRLQAELDVQVEAAIRRLHRDLDNDDTSTAAAAKESLAALALEREILGRIPTWPWRGGTLTAVLSAVALPLVIFLMQVILQRWLGA